MKNLEEEMIRQRHSRPKTQSDFFRNFPKGASASMIKPVLKTVQLLSPLTSLVLGPSAHLLNIASGIVDKLV